MNAFILIVGHLLGGVLALIADLALGAVAGVIVWGGLVLAGSDYATIMGLGVFLLEFVWLRYTDDGYEPEEEAPDE